MTARPIGYGIDFGTSNSTVAIAYADRVEVVPLGSHQQLGDDFSVGSLVGVVLK